MICAIVIGPSFEEALKQLALAQQDCSLAEVRLDLFNTWDLTQVSNLKRASKIPLLLTLRSTSQGGKFAGSVEERLHLIQQLASLHPDYLDVEYPAPPEFVSALKKAHPQIELILSFHDFEKTPPLPPLLHEMQKIPADLYKIATFLHSSTEALQLLTFMKSHSNVLAMGMGPYGSFTRILSPLFGGRFVYASLHDTLSTAPGQLSVQELKSTYHYHLLNDKNSFYGLIGDPVTKSVSHLSHNQVMEKLKIPSVYLKFPLTAIQLPSFLAVARETKIRGLSVTMPLKEEIIPYLDYVDPWAKRVGAVNTLVFEGNTIKGYNTDGKGALDAIESKMKVEGKKVMLIGAGGACKALAAEALDRGASVAIFNRHEERAKAVAHSLGCEGGGFDQLPQAYDVIINTTPDPMPIQPEWMLAKTLAMDIALQPPMTDFLRCAELRGCSLVYGYEMFINQAMGQFKLWFKELDGEKAHEILQRTVKEAIQKCADRN